MAYRNWSYTESQTVCTPSHARGRRTGSHLALAAMALLLAGCSSISIPLSGLYGGTKATDGQTIKAAPVTGVSSQALPPLAPPPPAAPPAAPTAPAASSSPPPPPAKAPLYTGSVPDANVQTAAFMPLTEDDKTIVAATLSQAMLDQEKGATVPWLNEKSGIGGLIVPVASPLKQEDAVCRAVIVSQTRNSDTQWMQAEACKPLMEGSTWRLLNVRAWRNPA